MSDLFNMDLISGNEFLDGKKTTNDGLFRPRPADAKDPKLGYRAKIRFLANVKQDGTLGQNAIHKMVRYVKLQEYPNLTGFYDSMKNFGEPCELTNVYWKLYESGKAGNFVDKQNAEKINKSDKYYSYIQIIEDENNPENVGKIMIFAFGKKIKAMIAEELSGEITGSPCNVYDPIKGKDFTLLVKGTGLQTSYESSRFSQIVETMMLPSSDGTMKRIPTTINEDGVTVVDPRIQGKILEYLKSRDVELEAHMPVRWNEDTRKKVEQIVAILTNNPVVQAKSIIEKNLESDYFASETTTATASSGIGKDNTEKTEDEFFDF